MNIYAEIERIFEENGVDISDSASLENVDSIQYVTIIVEIEQFFNITLPDYFFVENSFVDYQKLINIVTYMCENPEYNADTRGNSAMLSKNNNVV